VLKAVENSAASYLHLAEDILLQQKQKAMAEHKRLQAQQGEDCRCHRQGAYAAEWAADHTMEAHVWWVVVLLISMDLLWAPSPSLL